MSESRSLLRVALRDPLDKEVPMKPGLALAIMLLFAAACSDKPEKSAAPTEPSATIERDEVAPVPSMSSATVCLSYGRDRELVRAELRDNPPAEKLEKLKTRLKSLEELILDAC